jgi:hypothetical protein
MDGGSNAPRGCQSARTSPCSSPRCTREGGQSGSLCTPTVLPRSSAHLVMPTSSDIVAATGASSAVRKTTASPCLLPANGVEDAMLLCIYITGREPCARHSLSKVITLAVQSLAARQPPPRRGRRWAFTRLLSVPQRAAIPRQACSPRRRGRPRAPRPRPPGPPRAAPRSALTCQTRRTASPRAQ